MSSEVNNIRAELRRDKDLWKLGPDCPKEGLMAHALFDHLVYSNEINALDEQGKERKTNGTAGGFRFHLSFGPFHGVLVDCRRRSGPRRTDNLALCQ